MRWKRMFVFVTAFYVAVSLLACESYDKQKAKRIEEIVASEREAVEIQQLEQYLTDPQAFIRYRAAKALNKVGKSTSVPALIKALEGDDDLRVRMYAASALGKIKDERALEPLIEALHDPAFNVRYKAAHALGVLGNPKAVSALKKTAVNDGHVYVRNHAVRSLKMLEKPVKTPK